jgi:hypothetical protein
MTDNLKFSLAVLAIGFLFGIGATVGEAVTAKVGELVGVGGGE